MTLTIENVDMKFVPAFKSLAKAANAKCKMQSKAKTWKKESQELIKLYKQGKIKAFENAKDFRKAIENNEV